MPAAQRWFLKRRPSEQFIQEMGANHFDPVLAAVLYARKIDTLEHVRVFLSNADELADPFQMAGMEPAAERLAQALRQQERLVVYGDFDVDGVSATSLLVSALQQLGADVSPYIPDRFSESYGLNNAALKKLCDKGVKLVITVDCGIRSIPEVTYGQSLGLDMIVTDHHSVAVGPDDSVRLPPALAVLNPKRPDCPYPFKGLSGVGVAYRLVDALSRHMAADLDLSQFLDLVALGTVADVVPLVEENRLLVQRGLDRMRQAPRLGLAALLEVAGVRQDLVDSQAIGFRLGPRLNAAGRLQTAMLAYNLLLSQSQEEAKRLAATLNEVNQERQHLLECQVEQARTILEDGDGQKVLFVAGKDFHEGIVGLVASRLVEEFYRPTLVMRQGPHLTRGSARSIEGFNITRAMDHCSSLFTRYGGHAMAAGFTIPTKNLPAFRDHLQSYSADLLTEDILSPRFSVDALVKLGDLSEETCDALALLEPCGEGNPPPALASTGLRLQALQPIGQEGKHLRMYVADGTRTLQAIAFRMGHLATHYQPGAMLDLIYRPNINEWQGERTLQLVVEAIRPSNGINGKS